MTRNICYFSILVAVAIVILGPVSIGSSVFAQTEIGSTSFKVINALGNNSQSQIEQLNKAMAELESSNNPALFYYPRTS
jgi:hypothetical protein